ncbi:MAG: sigma-70 family RNA polymerase sigma factor [Ruminococcus sp.]|nr:sigma-70 family RNA polymerase sigma factor [Ruminococcus sp.]
MNRAEINKLVVRAQNGDRLAFEELYNEFRDRVFFFAKRTTGNADAAEDITSETFVKALESIGTLREGESFVGWLYTIAYNLCMAQLRDNSHIERFGSDEAQTDAVESAALREPVMLPEDYAVSAETKRKLGEIIDSLSPDMRSAVILYYYGEQTIPEVAKALGTNEHNASQKLYKAKKRIRKGLEKVFGKGALLAAVPMEALLRTTEEAEYVKAAAAGAKVAGLGIGAKIAAVGATAVIAVGVPIGLYRLGESKGDYRPEDISAVSSEAEASDSVSSEEHDDDAIVIVATSEKTRLSDKALKAVEARLAELGVDKKIKLVGYDLEKYEERLSSDLNHDRQADIIFTGYGTEDAALGTYKQYIDDGRLISLDGYMQTELGQKLADTYGQTYLDCLTVNGSIYGFTPRGLLGYGISIVFNDDICARYSIDPQGFDGSLEWLSEQCGKITENDIDLIEFQLDANSMKQLAGYEYDPELFAVGEGVRNGVRENIYLNIKDFTDQMAELRSRGYIADEPKGRDWFVKFVNTDCKNISFVTGEHYPEEQSFTVHEVCKPTAYKVMSGAVGVSSNSRHPDEAFKVLALIYTDRELADLITYGIAGEDCEQASGMYGIVRKDGSAANPLANELIITGTSPVPTDEWHKICREYNDSLTKPSTLKTRLDMADGEVSRAYSENKRKESLLYGRTEGQ